MREWFLLLLLFMITWILCFIYVFFLLFVSSQMCLFIYVLHLLPLLLLSLHSSSEASPSTSLHLLRFDPHSAVAVSIYESIGLHRRSRLLRYDRRAIVAPQLRVTVGSLFPIVIKTIHLGYDLFLGGRLLHFRCGCVIPLNSHVAVAQLSPSLPLATPLSDQVVDTRFVRAFLPRA